MKKQNCGTCHYWQADVVDSMTGVAWRCARCGDRIPEPKTGKHYCSEQCRKRAERARWKAKWKARGVNKYIGWRTVER